MRRHPMRSITMSHRACWRWLNGRGQTGDVTLCAYLTLSSHLPRSRFDATGVHVYVGSYRGLPDDDAHRAVDGLYSFTLRSTEDYGIVRNPPISRTTSFSSSTRIVPTFPAPRRS